MVTKALIATNGVTAIRETNLKPYEFATSTILTGVNFLLAIVGTILNIYWHVHTKTNTSPAGNLTFLHQGKLGAEHL